MMGSNKHGKLGLGLSQEEAAFVSHPMLVENLNQVSIIDISLGNRNSMAATDKG